LRDRDALLRRIEDQARQEDLFDDADALRQQMPQRATITRYACGLAPRHTFLSRGSTRAAASSPSTRAAIPSSSSSDPVPVDKEPFMSTSAKRYQWFAVGDINGFFGLMFDNMTVLSFLAGILVFAFGSPADIVYTRMFPGTAFGVLFGDLVYTWMAFRLARRTGNTKVTAMPLGLDTPSTIGIALAVLGPAFLALKAQGMEPREAALQTWYIGMATMILIGVIKLVLSFCGRWVQKIVPQAGLLGSLAGIGLALIGFVPLVDIFGMPLIGMVSLGLILYNLVARIRLPWNMPGVLLAIGVGTALYYLLGPSGLIGGTYAGPSAEFHLAFPVPTFGFLHGLGKAFEYLPIAFPFALLTVVGGINVTESARVAGDDFNTRDILLTEAVATLIAGLCGGVAQSTPYIGQPAYKGMGARRLFR